MASGESIGMIDLDAVLASPIKVKVDGATYKLPGDAPSELLLSIILATERLEEAVKENEPKRLQEIRGEVSDLVTELFSILQEVDEGFGSGLADIQIGELVSKLFAHYYKVDEDGDRPTADKPEAETPPRQRSGGRSRPRSGGRKHAPSSSAS